MKATERKELHTNTLKQFGQNLLHGGKGLPSTVWVLPILVLLVWAVYWFWSGIAATRTTNVWAYFWSVRSAQDPETEKRLKGTVAELSWKFEKADRLYQQGYSSLFSFPQQGVKNLKEASALYTEITQDTTAAPLMVMEAYSGAAKCEECLGEVERAAYYYQALLQRFGSDKNWSSIPLKPEAVRTGNVVKADKDWVHPLVWEAWKGYERLSKDGDERRAFASKWLADQLQMRRDRTPPPIPPEENRLPNMFGNP